MDSLSQQRDIRTKEEKQIAFLEQLIEHVSVTEACRISNVNRANVYAWLNKDPSFVKLFGEAEKLATKKLEDIAITRAVEYSDTLIQFLLRSRDPKKYNPVEKKEISGPEGGPIQTENITIIEL